MRVVKAAVLLTMMGVSAVTAQEHRHSVADTPMHEEFYKKWMQPPTRQTSCCNKEDCYATPIRFDKETGDYYALRREDQKWLKIRPEILEQHQAEDNIREAPDFQSHACIPKPSSDENGYIQDTVYCATLGEGN